MSFLDRMTRTLGGNRMLSILLLIIGATGLACLAWEILGGLLHASPRTADRYLALSASPLTAITHPWTILTYMAVHYSALHLLFNLLWLYWFGRILTDIYDGRILLRLFIGGGVAGGVVYVAVSSLGGLSPWAYLTGDSAAVLAVMAATGILLPDIRLRLFILGEVRLKWVALGCILLTLAGSGSGWAVTGAHLGGVAWGAALSIARRRGFSIQSACGFNKKDSRSVKGNRRGQSRKFRASKAASAMQNLDDHRRLDELLDKIRISGYDALTEREKTELNHISSRIEN